MPSYRTVRTWLQKRTVSQGRHRGKKLKLLNWQGKFLQALLDPRYSTLAISMARGNGKTCFLGAVAACAIGGPLAQPRADVYIVASAFDQGCVLFDFAVDFLGEDDRFTVYRSDKTARAYNKEIKSNLTVLAPDMRTLQGKAGALWLCDEPSAWLHTRAELIAGVVDTSLGKIPDSKAVYLGTRPAEESHFFQKLLDGEADYSLSYQTEPHLVDEKPLNWYSIRQANPSLSHLPDLKDLLEKQRKRAARDEGFLQMFKNLRLNGGVPMVREALILEAATWQRIEGNAKPEGRCIWGVDLSTNWHMSAVCAFYPKSGRVDAVAAFPREPSLASRALKDGAGSLYQKLADRGELILAGHRVVDVEELLRVALERFGKPSRIVCDDHRYNPLLQALVAAEIPFVPIEKRRMGWKDGTEDLSTFRKAALSEPPLMVPVKGLLLRSSLKAARTASDVSGNQKLGKRPVGMDDALSAAILAVSSGVRIPPGDEEEDYELIVAGR